MEHKSHQKMGKIKSGTERERPRSKKPKKAEIGGKNRERKKVGCSKKKSNEKVKKAGSN